MQLVEALALRLFTGDTQTKAGLQKAHGQSSVPVSVPVVPMMASTSWAETIPILE